MGHLVCFFFYQGRKSSPGTLLENSSQISLVCVLGLRLTATSVTGRKGSESWDWLGPPAVISWDQAFGHKDLLTNLGVILLRKIRQGMFPVDLSSLTRDRTCIPCMGRHSHNHWPTKEVPLSFFSLYFCGYSELAKTLLFLDWRDQSKVAVFLFCFFGSSFFCLVHKIHDGSFSQWPRKKRQWLDLPHMVSGCLSLAKNKF